jgi:hypothetical protein
MYKEPIKCGLMVFYDVSSSIMIERMRKFVTARSLIHQNNIRYILVGDLASDKQRLVTYDEMSQFASDYRFEYLEANTETNYNVSDTIWDLARTQGRKAV